VRDFAKLTNAYCQVEGAADLLGEGNADRLALAMHDACIADKEEMGRTLRFLDWLLDESFHLDGMLAEIHGIAPEAFENERRLRGEAMRRRARLAVVHQQAAISRAVTRGRRRVTATGKALDATADTRDRPREIKAAADQLKTETARQGAA